jgi:hypothetical protein
VQDNRSNPSTAKDQLSLSSSRPLSPPLIPGPPQTRSTQELLSTFSGLPPTYQQAVSQKASIEPAAISTYNLLPPTYQQVVSQQPPRSSNEEPPLAAAVAARLPLTYEQIIATRASPTLSRVETLDFMWDLSCCFCFTSKKYYYSDLTHSLISKWRHWIFMWDLSKMNIDVGLTSCQQ